MSNWFEFARQILPCQKIVVNFELDIYFIYAVKNSEIRT